MINKIAPNNAVVMLNDIDVRKLSQKDSHFITEMYLRLCRERPGKVFLPLKTRVYVRNEPRGESQGLLLSKEFVILDEVVSDGHHSYQKIQTIDSSVYWAMIHTIKPKK